MNELEINKFTKIFSKYGFSVFFKDKEIFVISNDRFKLLLICDFDLNINFNGFDLLDNHEFKIFNILEEKINMFKDKDKK